MPYLALDLDAARVREARTAGEPVYYADATERDILEAVGLAGARLMVISHEDTASALKVLHHVRTLRPSLPVMVRTRDESPVEELRLAGATEVIPESLEASLMIASQALLLLGVPQTRVLRRIQRQRADSYQLLRELFRGDSDQDAALQGSKTDRLLPVPLVEQSRSVGKKLAQMDLDGVLVTALVRRGQRDLSPPPDTVLEAGDVLVLFGSDESLGHAERALLG